MGKFISSNSLKCFSPPVMVATFIFEIGSAIFLTLRYRLNVVGRLIILLLACLSFFQLAEYFVCTHSTAAILASRLGYAAITLLPPLGLYLMAELTERMQLRSIIFMFSVAVLLVIYFLLSPNAFIGYECAGNYVIFQLGRSQTGMYSTYYFGLIVISLLRGSRFIRDNPGLKKSAKSAINWLIVGYLVFIIPVAVLLAFHPSTKAAVPSVMCGFAVGLAVVLVTKLAPLRLKTKKLS